MAVKLKSKTNEGRVEVSDEFSEKLLASGLWEKEGAKSTRKQGTKTEGE